MPKTYFFRDINNISELQVRTSNAIKNQATPIPFNIDVMIELSDDDFNEFSSQISKDHFILERYKNRMIADRMGVWNCVVIKNKKTNEKVAVYYGGFKYPRFVGLV